MRGVRAWRQLFGVDARTVVEDVEFEDGDEVVVAHVRPRRPTKRRCGLCERSAAGHDHRDGRWRGLDLGTVKVFWKPTRACQHVPR